MESNFLNYKKNEKQKTIKIIEKQIALLQSETFMLSAHLKTQPCVILFNFTHLCSFYFAGTLFSNSENIAI